MTSPASSVPKRVELDAPAKLNLGLRVLGRRPDGYHLLESLFVPIDWCDRVEVEVDPGAEPGVSFRLEARSGEAVPGDASNLAARAAAAYVRRVGLRAAVRVRLVKSLPAAAGLGGGSSDAAAVLRALDHLVDSPLPPRDIGSVALALGADVPFFLDPRPALVTGIGERIEPLAGVPGLWLVLANPGNSLATADVYAAWDRSAAALTPAEAGSTMRALSRLLDSPDPSRVQPAEFLASVLGDVLVNDLEAAARELCPGVGWLQDRLRALGALATGMSGSGATVFGVFADESGALRARSGLLDAVGSSEEARSFEASGAWARVVRSAGSESAAEGGPRCESSDPGASPNW